MVQKSLRARSARKFLCFYRKLHGSYAFPVTFMAILHHRSKFPDPCTPKISGPMLGKNGVTLPPPPPRPLFCMYVVVVHKTVCSYAENKIELIPTVSTENVCLRDTHFRLTLFESIRSYFRQALFKYRLASA